MKGFGTVVTGTLVSGRIAVDDELRRGAGRTAGEGARRAGARQRGQPEAVAGQRAAVNLAGV